MTTAVDHDVATKADIRRLEHADQGILSYVRQRFADMDRRFDTLEAKVDLLIERSEPKP